MFKHLRQLFSLPLIVMLFSSPVLAGEDLAYKDSDTPLLGYWAKPAETCENEDNAPLVLIVHQWKGLSAHEKESADRLSAQCYNAFAIDMYGQGIRPETAEDAGKQAGIYKGDPALARSRLTHALEFAKGQAGVDPSRIAILGYCFGGTMALELARTGADINAAISFHGGLSSKAPVTEAGTIKATIQVHHGADDPHVPPEEVKAFTDEMNMAKADWMLTQYAGAVHAFTHKDAGNDPSKGIAYNEKADTRSWSAMTDLLETVFAE